MNSIACTEDKAEILRRLGELKPDTNSLWGRMSANQMVCHLTDSFRSALGDRPVAPVSNAFSRTVMKWIALKTPLTWPHGLQTRPEVDQEQGGTPPSEFAADVDALVRIVERFAAGGEVLRGRAHSIFGPLTHEEWSRWGYLHMDHHLRQFGL